MLRFGRTQLSKKPAPVFGGAVPFDGVFFDTTRGDSFSGRMNYAADGTLAVNSNNIVFNSAAAVTKLVKLNDPFGNPLKHAFDTWEADATYSMTLLASYAGLYSGAFNDLGFPEGVRVSNPFGIDNYFLSELIANAALQATDGSFTPGAPQTVRVRTRRTGIVLTEIINYNGGADRGPFSRTQTLGKPVDSFEQPRLFDVPLAGQFMQGTITQTAYKFTASFPNARFGVMGDSIAQARFCTAYADGWVQLLRAAYPNNVAQAAAPSAATADWLNATYGFTKMKPKYAFVMLGTNDVGTSVPEGTIETRYTSLINSIIAGGSVPIVLTIPPNGNLNTPTFNTWIKAQPWRFIDIYPLLFGSGFSMNATYDSGDGIHPNTAGNLVIYNAVQAYITAQGL